MYSLGREPKGSTEKPTDQMDSVYTETSCDPDGWSGTDEKGLERRTLGKRGLETLDRRQGTDRL